MVYRTEAKSDAGFMRILTANYLPAGYYFYSQGRVPAGKDPRAVDEKLVEKYGIDVSRSTRWRRKKAGYGNVHYVRFERKFLLLAIHGRHRFFDEEDWKDCRRVPISFGGYSITCKQGNYLSKCDEKGTPIPDQKYRVRVLVARPVFACWRQYFANLAQLAGCKRIARELYCWPYFAYGPVRKQWLQLIRVVNKVRCERGRSKIDADLAMRTWREPVKPFEDAITLECFQRKWQKEFDNKWNTRFKIAV